MEPIYVQLFAAILTPLATVIVAWIANNKSRILLEYKLDELRARVDKHNNLIERMYKVENEVNIVKTKLEDLDN